MVLLFPFLPGAGQPGPRTSWGSTPLPGTMRSTRFLPLLLAALLVVPLVVGQVSPTPPVNELEGDYHDHETAGSAPALGGQFDSVPLADGVVAWSMLTLASNSQCAVAQGNVKDGVFLVREVALKTGTGAGCPLARAPSGNLYLNAGQRIYKSEDGGIAWSLHQTFTLAENFAPGGNKFTLLDDDDWVLMAAETASSGKFFAVSDGGVITENDPYAVGCSSGLCSASNIVIVDAPAMTNFTYIYATTGGAPSGVAYTSDAGATWSTSSLPSLDTAEVGNAHRLAYDGTTLTAIYAITQSASITNTHRDVGMVTSTDGGATWSPLTRIFRSDGVVDAGRAGAWLLGDEVWATMWDDDTGDMYVGRPEGDGSYTWHKVSRDNADNFDAASIANSTTGQIWVTGGNPWVTFTEGGTGALKPTEEVAVDDLMGFAMDASDTVILTRLGGTSDKVASFDAGTIDPYGEDATDYCGISEGIATYLHIIVYVKCSGGSNVDAIAIRESDFSSAEKPQGDTTNQCLATYDETDDGVGDQLQIPDLLQDLHAVTLYSFEPAGFSDIYDACLSAFAFSTSDGKLGVAAQLKRDGPNNDETVQKTVQFSTQLPDDTCFFQASTGDYYLGAVGAGGTSTSLYKITVRHDHTFGDNDAGVTMDRVIHSPGQLASGRGFDCKRDVGVIQNDDGLVQVFRIIDGGTGLGAGKVLKTWQAVADVPRRGVALSVNAEWVAYYAEPGVFHVANVASGVVVAALEIPGDPALAVTKFRGVHLAGDGSVAWIATEDALAKYVIKDFTCQLNCTSYIVTPGGAIQDDLDDAGAGGGGGSGSGLDTPSGTCPGGGTGLFGDTICSDIDTDGDGVPEVDGTIVGWLVGFLLVLAMTFGVGAVSGKAVGFGGAVGVTAAVGLQFWPLWTVALAGLAGIASTVLMVVRR